MELMEKEIALLHKKINTLTEEVGLLAELVREGNTVNATPEARVATAAAGDDEPLPFELTAEQIDASPFQLTLEGIDAPSCKVDACQEEILSKGFCSSHYYRNLRYGHPLAAPPRKSRQGANAKDKPAKGKRRRKKQFCTYSECRGEYHAKGLCSYHYYRQKTYGDPSGDTVDTGAPVTQAEESVSRTETREEVGVS